MIFSLRTWFFIGIASLSCIPITLHFFPIAFPILSLNITMNRSQALAQACAIAEQYHFAPAEFDQVAIFHLDDAAKTFIELDGGGKDALTDIMQRDLYMPYVWVVRHFKENNPRSSYIFFKPDGTPYGFEQTFSENDPGENLSPEYARVIAETQARDAWHIDLSSYTPIETAQETHPSGRVDHTFVYERTGLTIGSGGTYRLKLGVSGDQFSSLSHALYIPDTFKRHYEQMRSANETIAQAAGLWYRLFYFLGGCVLALLWLARTRWLIIRTPLIWALAIAFLIALSKLNQLPVIWISYDTALPAQDFLLNYLTKILNELVRTIIPLALAFIAAESLSRKAFGNQPQFWHTWSLQGAASSAIAGSTLGAYALVSFDFALASIFYAFTITYYHWWVPSSQFFDPNILATFLPWLEPCVDSLYAGFQEECMFRAIPLAGAALIGDRIGKRNLMIILALIMQAIVFSAAHANYPGQPAYARLVELLLPSTIYALIYLRYGLLPVIISHTLYDIVWMALPLFASHAPYAWINQLMVIAIALIPAAIVIHARIRTGAWTLLPDALRNSAWQPSALTSSHALPHPDILKPISQVLTPLLCNGLLISGILGIPLWMYVTNFHNDALPLYTTREQALIDAQAYARKHGMSADRWYPIVTAQNTDDNIEEQHRFVWQHTNRATYTSLLNTYLIQPRWFIRFVNFDKDLIERSEEFQVGIQDINRVHGFQHIFPESAPGVTLSKQQATARMHEIIAQETGFDPNSLLEMEASPLKLPARTDWQFILADPVHYPLTQGQGRLCAKLAGDAFSRLSWSVHVPEVWERADRSLLNKTTTIKTFCSLLLYLIALCAAYAMAHTRRFPLTFAIWRMFFGFLLFMKLITIALSWHESIAHISTSEPFYHQLFAIFGSQLIQGIMYMGVLSVLLMAVTNIQYRYALPHTPYKHLCALGLGMLSAALLSCIEYCKPSLTAHWANYNALNSLAPTTTIMINAITQLFMFGAALGMLYALIDYVTNSGTRNHLVGALFMLLFGLCIVSYDPMFSIPYWLFAGTATGLLITAVYYFLLCYDRALLPLVLLPVICTVYIQQAALNAFTESISMHLLAVAYSIIAACFWSYSFNLEPETSE